MPFGFFGASTGAGAALLVPADGESRERAVVTHCRREGSAEGQWTVVTEARGPQTGRRWVGRREEQGPGDAPGANVLAVSTWA